MSTTIFQTHEPVAQQLSIAVLQHRLAHGYLMIGPRGIGKFEFAREFSRVLLCETRPQNLSACGRCASCRLIDSETHPDFLVIRTPDDKHELPVELIRGACEWVGIKSSLGERKIIIIQDGDDLNEESSNSFLKTLEEPPPGSLVFILATTRETQLQTIRSRCQQLTFRALNAHQLRALLEQNETLDQTRIDLAIALAGGSTSLATHLADDSYSSFANDLLAILRSDRPWYGEFGQKWLGVIEHAGKETTLQRAAATDTLTLIINALRTVLALDGIAPDALPQLLWSQFQDVQARLSDESILELLEAVLLAQNLIDRRVQIAIVIEELLDRWAVVNRANI